MIKQDFNAQIIVSMKLIHFYLTKINMVKEYIAILSFQLFNKLCIFLV